MNWILHQWIRNTACRPLVAYVYTKENINSSLYPQGWFYWIITGHCQYMIWRVRAITSFVFMRWWPNIFIHHFEHCIMLCTYSAWPLQPVGVITLLIHNVRICMLSLKIFSEYMWCLTFAISVWYYRCNGRPKFIARVYTYTYVCTCRYLCT